MPCRRICYFSLSEGVSEKNTHYTVYTVQLVLPYFIFIFMYWLYMVRIDIETQLMQFEF
jgi:hypothetical protein